LLTRKPDDERRINNSKSANYNHNTAEETSKPDNKESLFDSERKLHTER
jgi:hypothetical protein